ncbi:MAG: MFS transporter [Acidobacteria bacterium]|nr:MFS transporter [Acidobacteriota bacterium]
MSQARYAWLLVGLLWVVAFLNYIDRQVIFSLFPLLDKEFHLSGAELGFLSTAFVWVYGLVSPFCGYMADRFGRVRVILLSLLIWSLVTWATGHARSYGELIAARAMMGLSEAFYLPAALALIADHHGERTRSLATGLHQSGLYTGIVLGGVGGGWLGDNYGWRSPFTLLGAAGVAYFALLAWGLRRSARAATHGSALRLAGSLRKLSGLHGFWRVTLVFSAVGLANWLVYTWLPLYLYERFRLTLTSAGFSATFYIQAASFAGIVVGGLAADYWGSRHPKGRIWVQTAGLAAAAPFLFLIGVANSMAFLTGALLVFGLGRGIYDSNAMPVLCQIAPAELRSTGYGVFNLVSCIVGGIAAAAAGYLKAAIGLGAAFQIAAGVLVAAAITLLAVRPNPEAESREGSFA